jgi:hypothetical protein
MKRKMDVELVDEAFLVEMEKQFAWKGIDVRMNEMKARAWLIDRPGRKFTRKFFCIGCLGRIQAQKK